MPLQSIGGLPALLILGFVLRGCRSDLRLTTARCRTSHRSPGRLCVVAFECRGFGLLASLFAAGVPSRPACLVMGRVAHRAVLGIARWPSFSVHFKTCAALPAVLVGVGISTFCSTWWRLAPFPMPVMVIKRGFPIGTVVVDQKLGISLRTVHLVAACTTSTIVHTIGPIMGAKRHQLSTSLACRESSQRMRRTFYRPVGTNL